ncbi:MAG: hypothetical protein M1826_001935 [Phylliscum demangeonii]|nr:MAG: hypothetical protein M1826_001935 [Phylliscum demangeonii]
MYSVTKLLSLLLTSACAAQHAYGMPQQSAPLRPPGSSSTASSSRAAPAAAPPEHNLGRPVLLTGQAVLLIFVVGMMVDRHRTPNDSEPAPAAPISPRPGPLLYGYEIEDVPPVLRTPIVVEARDLGTLSAFGRRGPVSQRFEPIPALQALTKRQPDLQPRYFAYEAEKTKQVTAVIRAMMESSAFQDCMFPCLQLPAPRPMTSFGERAELPTDALALLFCGVKCQHKTGQLHRAIAFTRVARYLPRCVEDPAWHDYSQDHAPSFMAGARLPPAALGVRLLPPSRAWARFASEWHGVQRAALRVVRQEAPALEREMFARERGWAAAGGL